VVVAARAEVSRTAARDAIKSGAVTVSGEIVRPSRRLEQGDEVAGAVEVVAEEHPEAERIPLEVRYSDDRVLVVSKPPGLVTHPATGNPSGTLVNALLALGGPLSRLNPMRPGIVHRLDKDTSGLLVVAKDDEAHEFLSEELKARRIDRYYFALVRGQMPAPSGSIEAPIGRHAFNKHKMTVTPEGRDAVTHYRVLQQAERCALLEVKLETGRTHQIRVHLAHIKHPVLGDSAYGGRSEYSRSLGLDRPFLHAFRLIFPHPSTGERIEVLDPLPDDLSAALAAAGLDPADISETLPHT
jgi:23S rRNA pseudouridine1911/1915/1917 synthase